MSERSLRILMGIPFDLYYQPFTIRSIRFAEELARRGHEVTVVYAPMREGRRGRAVRTSLPSSFRAIAFRMVREPGRWPELSELVAAADVVHFQKCKPPMSWIVMGLARYHGKPLHQDWDDDELAFWRQATLEAATNPDVPWTRRVPGTARAAAVMTMSGATEYVIPRLVDTVGGATASLRRMSLERGCAAGDIFPARVGVDADQFHPGRRDEALRRELGLAGPTIIYAGSFDVLPDLLFFVEALKVTFAQVPSARCLVVGDGFGRRRFVRLLEEAGFGSRAVLTGGLVPFAEMPRYVASCDLAALPFRDTAINRSKSSLTLLECMASGLAVVTHDVGDTAWTLGGCGEVARPDDARDFGARMARLATDEAYRRSLGEKARERAAGNFSWERSVDWLEEAYRRAMAKRRVPA
ncbi:MAG: glycosyltransferase [Deltaproteobacteria bacterium]|nr:glycosyltransferase [Deltaproteobacteria bacterium]